MKRNIIKVIIDLAVIAAAYVIGKNKGYEKGWTDGNMATACKRCVYHDDETEDCPDIPDFEGMYS